MRRAFIQILSESAGRLGLWHATRRMTRNVPRILMLHRFSARPTPRSTDAAQFVRLLDRVGAQCEFTTVRDLTARFAASRFGKRPPAVITVDDGYADFYEVALPVLRERGIPATLYATAGFIDGATWLWWDALRYLIDVHPGGQLRLDIVGASVTLAIGDGASRHYAWNVIADRLVGHNEARFTTLAALARACGTHLPERIPKQYAPMTWAQLAEAEAAGIEIGGHTMTHAFLPSLAPPALHTEIHDAKALLERHLRAPLVTFAYPNGLVADHSPAVEAAVRDAGFAAAVLAYPRPFDAADRYRLGRWSVGATGPALDRVLCGASELKLRHALAR